MKRRILYLIPVFAFIALIGVFDYRLMLMKQGDSPDIIPSAMIGKPVPAFNLPPILARTRGFKTADLTGKVTLINFFASWCVPCHAEHPLLMNLHGKGAVLAGINYKNKADDAKMWLAAKGNPYDTIAADTNGRTAIDFGVYGVPETFLIDKQGIIRFRQPGPLTPEIIQNQLLPMIEELNQ